MTYYEKNRIKILENVKLYDELHKDNKSKYNQEYYNEFRTELLADRIINKNHYDNYRMNNKKKILERTKIIRDYGKLYMKKLIWNGNNYVFNHTL
jgi:CRISPR/Cas system-associated protein Cas5 (RAMP superfamily)